MKQAFKYRWAAPLGSLLTVTSCGQILDAGSLQLAPRDAGGGGQGAVDAGAADGGPTQDATAPGDSSFDGPFEASSVDAHPLTDTTLPLDASVDATPWDASVDAFDATAPGDASDATAPLDAGIDTGPSTDAGRPFSARVEMNCKLTTVDFGEDCSCLPNEIAIGGGAAAGDPSKVVGVNPAGPSLLNGIQAGPSFTVDAGTVWRITTVLPDGTRIPPTLPYAVCLDPGTTANVRIAMDQCSLNAGPSGPATDCYCNTADGEIAISGGGYSGAPNDMMNATQTAQTGASWRVSGVDPTGTRVSVVDPFAVCLTVPDPSVVRFESVNCARVDGGATECYCQPSEVAISGGAYSGDPSYAITANQAGPSYDASAQTWRVAAGTLDGGPVPPISPFAVCLTQ